jgi:hypothetical protein
MTAIRYLRLWKEELKIGRSCKQANCEGWGRLGTDGTLSFRSLSRYVQEQKMGF